MSRRVLLRASVAGTALSLVLGATASVLVRAAADSVTPGTLYIAGGVQQLTAFSGAGGMTGVTSVALADVAITCSAIAGSFTVVSDTTVDITVDPAASCLANGSSGDVVQVTTTNGTTSTQLQPQPPLTLAAGAGVPTPSPSTAPSPSPSITPPAAAAAPSPPIGAPPAASPNNASTPAAPVAAGSLVPSDAIFTLTASSMSLVGFTFSGVTTLTSGSGASIPVLVFTLTSTTAVDMSITRGCTGGQTLHSGVPSTSTATFSGAITLDLTQLQGTDSTGTVFQFAAGAAPAPPVPWSFVAPYTSVTMTAAAITASAGRLTLPSMSTTAAVC